MTSLVADHIRIEKRGRIRIGYAADLVLFDAGQIQDEATYEEPKKYPIGIEWVFINGRPVIKQGKYEGMKAGRFLVNS